MTENNGESRRQHTEDEPRLAEVKVDAGVRLKANVRDGHVSSWFSS